MAAWLLAGFAQAVAAGIAAGFGSKDALRPFALDRVLRRAPGFDRVAAEELGIVRSRNKDDG